MGQYFLTKKPLSAPNLSVPIFSKNKRGHSKQFDIYDSFKKWYNVNYKKIHSIHFDCNQLMKTLKEKKQITRRVSELVLFSFFQTGPCVAQTGP